MKKKQPISAVAWRLLVLETCGQIGCDQLDVFFEPGTAMTWKVNDEYRKHLSKNWINQYARKASF